LTCILRAEGKHLDVDAVTRAVQLPFDRVWKVGQRKEMRGGQYESSGVTVVASSADTTDFQTQLDDAGKFLTECGSLVKLLAESRDLESIVLDFGVALNPEHPFASFSIPSNLLKLASAAGVDIEISVYPAIE
jgi:hypothetical protein